MVICRCTVQKLISFSFTGEWSPGALESGDQCWRNFGNAGDLEYHLEPLESLGGKQNTGKCVGSVV